MVNKAEIATAFDKASTKLADWSFNLMPDDDVVWLTTQLSKKPLYERAPGKYNLLYESLDRLSNTNPIHLFFPHREIFGHGLVAGYDAAHNWGRFLDDVLDKDRLLPPGFDSFPELVDHFRHIINTGGRDVPKDQSIDFLLKYAVRKIEAKQRRGDNVRGLFLRFLDGMMFEYNVRQNRGTFSQAELARLYNDVFGAPYSIFLIAAGSSTRDQDIPELAQLQGRLYAIDGMKEDLPKSICYIPEEIVKLSTLTLSELLTDPSLIDDNLVIQNWIRAEIADARDLILRLKGKKLDFKGKLFININIYLLKKAIIDPLRNQFEQQIKTPA